MNNERTPQECKQTVINSINLWIGKDMCQKCAMKAVASLLDMAYETVERLWVEHNVDLLDAETALD